MDPILLLQVSVEKLRSLLRKGAQICAWFEFHVADAERQIRRIEHRLRDGAPIAVNVDLAARIAEQQQEGTRILAPPKGGRSWRRAN